MLVRRLNNIVDPTSMVHRRVYDDVGGYSSYISHANPQYMMVAIGW